ncbi:MAG: dissimilatory-type sulfite reductase subunit alpha [Nitrospinae bacterium]|nr:dissimilatory-type sulfite reductase subunit alpha [Nitrospinota bacterium]
MSDTPLLDELDKGPWPSFIGEMKKMAVRKPMVKDLLGQLELSYRDRVGHWKHGGLVGVHGYGSGVIGRYSSVGEQFPEVAQFHTMRINQPAAWFYTSDAIRQLCDIWDKYGSGLTNMHGTTGDVIFLGAKTENLEACFQELTHAGWDLGGSGSAMRTPSCCVGPARCEWACFDTLEMSYNITMTYQDNMHRPAFPYKFKFKFSGCPNDCTASIARSDVSVIGTWLDEIQVDQAAIKEYLARGKNIKDEVVKMCPTRCIELEGDKLTIDDAECTKCMHCINVLPKALRPGKERGAAILIGGKAPIVEGALLSSVIVPFMKLDDPDYEEFHSLVERIWDFWDEYGMNRERIGELIQRVGFGNFLEAVGLDPAPEMVKFPRDNPYIFYDEFFEEEGEGSDA